MANRAPYIREQADVRRDTLIEATLTVLARAGATGATVRAICTEAGVSPGLLRHYFDGIDALVLEACILLTRRTSDALAQSIALAELSPRTRLRTWLVASFRPPVSDPALLSQWLAFWSLAKTRPDIAQLRRDNYAASRAELEVLLQDAGLKSDKRRAIAIALSALVDGLWLELTLDPGNFSPSDAEAMIDRSLAYLLD